VAIYGSRAANGVKHTGFLTNNNLSVAGGDKKSNYFISLNYLSNKGIIKNQDYERINLRLNSDHIIRDRIKFGHSVNIYSASQTTQREMDWRDAYQASFRETPLNGMYDANGDVAPVVNNAFQGRAPSPSGRSGYCAKCLLFVFERKIRILLFCI
jgi:hypothetical protein